MTYVCLHYKKVPTQGKASFTKGLDEPLTSFNLRRNSRKVLHSLHMTHGVLYTCYIIHLLGKIIGLRSSRFYKVLYPIDFLKP